jgi:uncharacterized protein
MSDRGVARRRAGLSRGARLALAALLCCAAAWSVARAADAPAIPAPRGYVTDTADVIDAPTAAKIDALVTELQQKTGSQIAVLTVATTAPLDDFTYAMRVAEQWKVGKKGDDTGVLMLVAVQDRKIRVLTGYGVEGVLPDGLVGSIEDQEILPSFRSGDIGEGIWRGVAALAQRIAAERGVTLTGVPAPRARQPAGPGIPPWVLILLVMLVFVVMSQAGGRGGNLRRGGRGPVIFPGGFGGGGGGSFPGGFGGGGGGFGGFGGGGFGGGGAGRSW